MTYQEAMKAVLNGKKVYRENTKWGHRRWLEMREYNDKPLILLMPIEPGRKYVNFSPRSEEVIAKDWAVLE